MNPALDSAATRRRWARGVAVVSTAGALLLTASPAFAVNDGPRVLQAGARDSDTAEKPAILGPLLDFFRFGAGIGAPLVCQAGTSAVGSGANELGIAGQASVVIGKVNDGCDTASTQGTTYVDRGQELAKPLNVVNPYANPVLDAAAGAAEQYGEEYDETLSPFGPTIKGSGATLRWFEGR